MYNIYYLSSWINNILIDGSYDLIYDVLVIFNWILLLITQKWKINQMKLLESLKMN